MPEAETGSAPGGVAWLFPGQGSLRVGMGKALAAAEPAAAAVFAEADAALGFGLSALVFEGPEEELVRTANQQPAILATSLAYLAVLQERGLLPDPAFVAGHSLGEYSALVAAGALDLTEAVRLVRRRGELMQEHGAGAMAALLGMTPGEVVALAAEAGVEVANYNAPGQIVVSGRSEAVVAAVGLARGRGARRAVVLPVSGAFHSSLMAPVVGGLRPLVEAATVRPARVPLVANVNARPIREPDDLRRELLDQICAPVRWVDVVERLGDAGVSRFYEVGPGRVLTGLVGRIVAGSEAIPAEALLAEAAG